MFVSQIQLWMSLQLSVQAFSSLNFRILEWCFLMCVMLWQGVYRYFLMWYFLCFHLCIYFMLSTFATLKRWFQCSKFCTSGVWLIDSVCTLSWKVIINECSADSYDFHLFVNFSLWNYIVHVLFVQTSNLLLNY